MRPEKTEELKDVNLNIRCKRSQREKLKELAEQHGMTVSDYVLFKTLPHEGYGITVPEGNIVKIKVFKKSLGRGLDIKENPPSKALEKLIPQKEVQK